MSTPMITPASTPDTRMFVTATGMVCPVGLDAASACAAKRAGIAALADLPYVDQTHEPIIGATVPGLSLTLPRTTRLQAMLIHALADLMREGPDLPWVQVPLLLCTADPERPDVGQRGMKLAQAMVDCLHERLGIRFHPDLSRVLPLGHTAAFRALAHARSLLRDEQVPACLVCGADSLLNAAALHWLDRHDRLKTPANRDGVIPGEAAAAVLLEPHPRLPTQAEVTGLGFGQEQATLLSELPHKGLGLTAATRTALAEAGLGLQDIDLRLSDVTGELYGFKELPLMEARLLRVVRKEAQPLWHWSEAIGDIGAASGLAQLVLVDQAFRKGYAPGASALGLSSALQGDRAAVVLRRCGRSSHAMN